jgi:hypothetical protein
MSRVYVSQVEEAFKAHREAGQKAADAHHRLAAAKMTMKIAEYAARLSPEVQAAKNAEARDALVYQACKVEAEAFTAAQEAARFADLALDLAKDRITELQFLLQAEEDPEVT